ncbi:nucleotidyltransferase, partial [Vibrio vulnificus]
MISHITSNLDLTETQLSQLKTAYRAIGSYLANQGGELAECHIYAQGSVGIGTSVKPIDEDSDMDIDLVLHLPSQHYPTTTDEANELLFNLIRVL